MLAVSDDGCGMNKMFSKLVDPFGIVSTPSPIPFDFSPLT